MDERERSLAVRNIAKDGDPDRYLASLFAPAEARPGLFAIYALNVELARIAEQVNEPGLGAIRLEWWREAIERADTERTSQPVADAIGDLLKQRTVDRTKLVELVEARHFDVEIGIMPDRQSLGDYLDRTAGTLFSLAAAILGDSGPEAESAAHAAGRAYGLTGLMRALPLHAASGRVDLPADMLEQHGTSVEQVLAGEASAGLSAVLGELRRDASEALTEAERNIAKLPRKAHAAFIPLALVPPYLTALESVSSDPFKKPASINPLTRLWKLATWRVRQRAQGH